ncbi:MAG: hypothetical protein ACYCYF_09900 [Anaerolineae bacterium]
MAETRDSCEPSLPGQSNGSPTPGDGRERAHAGQLRLLFGVALVCALVLAVVALYSPSLQFNFWFDDAAPILTSVESRSALDLLVPVDTFGYYRPTGLLVVWAMVRLFGGYDVLACHALLLAMHVANMLLLGYLVERDTGRPLMAWLAAAAFGLSPLAPEAVTYMAAVFHPLVLFLVLLAWLARGPARERASVARLLVCALLLLLAAGAHETAIALALWIVATPWWLGRLPWREAFRPAAWLPLLGPLAYMAARAVLMDSGASLAVAPGVIEKARVLTQALLYPIFLAFGAGISPLTLGVGVIALVVLLAVLLRREDWRIWTWGLSWFVLAVVPVVLFLAFDYVVHGRRLGYVAGPGAAIVWAVPIAALLGGAARGWRLWLRRLVALGIIGSVLVLPVSAARDQLALFGHTSRIVAATVAAAEESPVDRPLVFVNLPYYWTPDVVFGADWEPPLPWFRWAQIVLPDYVDAHLLVRANNGPRREITQLRYPAYAPDVVHAGEEVSASRLRDLADSAQVYVLDLGTATFVDLTAAWQARDSGRLSEGEQALLAPLWSPRELPADGEIESAKPLGCRYPAGLRLESVAMPAQALPGDEASVALFWRLVEPWSGQDPVLRFAVTDAQGGSIYSQNTSLVPGLPLALWDANQVYVTRLVVPVPAGARVGLTESRLVLGESADSSWPVEGCLAGGGDRAVSLKWLIGERSVAASDVWPAAESPVAVLADGIALVGHALGDTSAAPGDAVTLTLFWRADRVPGRDYTVFRQVLDAAGQVVAQADSEPNRGLYPTSAWGPGELVRDAQELVLPDNLPEGEYSILVGMYHWPEMERLAVTGGGDAGQDAIGVGILDVKKR